MQIQCCILNLKQTVATLQEYIKEYTHAYEAVNT